MQSEKNTHRLVSEIDKKKKASSGKKTEKEKSSDFFISFHFEREIRKIKVILLWKARPQVKQRDKNRGIQRTQKTR